MTAARARVALRAAAVVALLVGGLAVGAGGAVGVAGAAGAVGSVGAARVTASASASASAPADVIAPTGGSPTQDGRDGGGDDGGGLPRREVYWLGAGAVVLIALGLSLRSWGRRGPDEP